MMEGVFIFTFLAIACIYFLGKYSIKRAWPVKDLDAPFDLDNGDLIFFSGATKGEAAISTYTNCYFTHIGFLFREEGVVYIWEADLGQAYRGGPRVIRLKDKLERWKGEKIFCIKRYIGDRPQLNDILRVIQKYVEWDMDENMVSWFLPQFSHLLRDEKKLFCSELVIRTFVELGMMSSPSHYTNFSPADLYRGRIDLVRGCYGPPHYFRIE
jgi:hypothetical protein